MAENKGYMTLSDEQGSIHISEEVIAAIAVGAVREVEGVSGMMGNLGTSVADLVTNKKGAQKNAKGVKIEMTETGLAKRADSGSVSHRGLRPCHSRSGGECPEGSGFRRQRHDGLHGGDREYPRGRRDTGLSGPEQERKGREIWYGTLHGKLPRIYPMS